MPDRSNRQIRAMLLSAGLGTRFRPITSRVPKPAVPFLNVPLMGYMLYEIEKIGLESVVFNTHHLPEQLRSCAECLTYGKNYEVHFSHEDKILGSGGGIRAAEKFLVGDLNNSNFIVANADEIMLFNHEEGLRPLLEYHQSQNALVTLLTTSHPEAGNRLGGVWVEGNSSGQIFKLGGQGSEPGALHFTGVYVFSSRVFQYMPRYGEFHIFKDALHKAMAAGEKVLSFFDGHLKWFDMSSESDYIHCTREALVCLAKENSVPAKELMATLNRFGQKLNRVSENQWMGPNAKFSGALNPDSYLLMGENSSIKANTKISDFAVIGANSSYGPGEIHSSVISPNVDVRDLSRLNNQLYI